MRKGAKKKLEAIRHKQRTLRLMKPKRYIGSYKQREQAQKTIAAKRLAAIIKNLTLSEILTVIEYLQVMQGNDETKKSIYFWISSEYDAEALERMKQWVIHIACHTRNKIEHNTTSKGGSCNAKSAHNTPRSSRA